MHIGTPVVSGIYKTKENIMIWSGRQDSNLRGRGPKPRAYPLGHSSNWGVGRDLNSHNPETQSGALPIRLPTRICRLSVLPLTGMEMREYLVLKTHKKRVSES